MAWMTFPAVGDAVRVLPWDQRGVVRCAAATWVQVEFAGGVRRVVALDQLRPCPEVITQTNPMKG